MKQLIVLSALILLCGLGYVIFSIMLFQPESVRPISYGDSSSAQTLVEEEKTEPALSNPKIQAQKDKALGMILDSIKSYEDVLGELPKAAISTHELFLQLVKRGNLPALYPVRYSQNSANPVEFEPLKIKPESQTSTSVAAPGINCSAKTSIFLGGVNNDRMICSDAASDVTRFLVSGPGDDFIQTGNAVTIVDSGAGNDEVQAGPNVTIIMLRSIEGDKVINMNCQRASMEGKKLSSEYPLSWIYPYRHFLVFGPQVIEDNLIIKGNTIEDPATNGKITLNGNCFNMVFASSSY